MISKVLQEKRKNLLESNKNSQELFLTKGFINILNYVDYQTLVNFVQDKEAFEIKIDASMIINKIIASLNMCQTNQDLIACIQSMNLPYDTSKIDPVEGSVKQRENIANNIGKTLLTEFRQIQKMHKLSQEEFYDSGKWCFWLCFGLLETTFNTVLSSEKSSIRAPLLSLPVGIKKVGDLSYILYKREKEFAINEILNIYLKDKINISYIDQAQLDANNDVKSLLTAITAKFEGAIFDDNSHVVPKVLKGNYTPLEKTTIFNYCFIGLLNPIGGKMLEDYDQILSQEYIFPQENSMFANQGLEDAIYKDDAIYEAGRLLNVSQKKAVIASLKTNTLIYGPPGTGKSEVVTSIIANNIAQGYNVLISSEKKAALDVINDRLGGLKAITMTIDPENIESFYEDLIKLNNLIITANPIKTDNSKPSYLALKDYISNLTNLQNNENQSQALNQLANKSSTFDTSKYEEVLHGMLNKANSSGWSLQDFVAKLYKFNIPCSIINNYYPINSSLVHIFSKDNLEKLFKNLNKADKVHKKFWIVNNFIKDNSPHAGLFPKKISAEQEQQLANLVDALNIIRNNLPYDFFINYGSWKEVIDLTDEKGLNQTLELFKSQNSKEFANLFDNLNKNNLLFAYLDQYWSESISRAEVTTKLLRDKYLYELKQKFIANPQLQANWIEMIKKANLPTKINVARFVKEYYNILKFIFPIWILSPDNVANYIPLNNHEFAVGIFDEASQMRVERSIPLIYRCTRNIVSGDDKQLRPSRFFAGSVSFDPDDLTSEEELDNVESLLDKAKIANWSSFTLNNHYRSNSEELINFSNKYIYDNKLICITKNGTHVKPIEVIQMPETTIYDRSTNTNPDEAKKAIEVITSNAGNYKKIVIITFNQKQADLIENLCYANPLLAARLENDTIRIRSIENVQGDEADLVVITTTFGKDAQGKFIQNFGPVGQAGGKNRINVMVTRAKEKMIIIKSFMSDAITSTNNENLYVLKMFLFYVENLQNDNNTIVRQDIKGTIKPIGLIVKDELVKLLPNLTIKDSYAIGSHNFDLAILNNENVQLLILIDDENDFKSKSINQWIDSIDKQKYYVDRGYKVLRFNHIEWQFNKVKIINKIKNLIN